MARDDEIDAYNRAHYLNNCLTPIFLTTLVLEAASFFLYTNMVTQTILNYLIFHFSRRIQDLVYSLIFQFLFLLQMHPWKKIIRGNIKEEETTTCFMCLERVTNIKFEKHMSKFHSATCPYNRLQEMCRKAEEKEPTEGLNFD